MRLQKKSYSRISLSDLLRRRKTNLNNFLQENGIVTYELLMSRCSSMGVIPPTEFEFLATKTNFVTHEISSPTEGVVVIQPQDATETISVLHEVQEQEKSNNQLSEVEDIEKNIHQNDNTVNTAQTFIKNSTSKKKKKGNQSFSM